jgi:hypothetical protein
MNEIRDERAKEFLVKAQALMEEEKYKEVVSYATAALEIMFIRANKFFFGEASFKFDHFEKFSNEVKSIKGIYVEKTSNKPELSPKLKEGIEILKKGVQDSEELLNETIICYFLDINIERYVRYRKMAGYFNTLASPPKSKSGMFSQVKFRFDKKDAEVSLDYCTKTIIDIQKTLEQFSKPLSEE